MECRLLALQMAWPYGDSPAQRRDAARERLQAVEDVDLLVLPELWPVGFFRFDDYVSAAEPLDGPTLTMCAEFSRSRACYVLTGSFVELAENGRLHNTNVLLDPAGEPVLVYRKMHLFGHMSREPELLTPGDALPVVDTPFGRIGLGTCYDLRFPEFFRTLTDRGAETVLVSSAWPMARKEHWELLLRARALENQLLVVGCNMAGSDMEMDAVYAGGSAIVGPNGRQIVCAEAGNEDLAATIPVQIVQDARRNFPVLKDRVLARQDTKRIGGGACL